MTKTKGDVIVEDIQIGDLHYEYYNGLVIEVEVTTKPQLNNDKWVWKSQKISDGSEVDYLVHRKYEMYAPALYTYNVQL